MRYFKVEMITKKSHIQFMMPCESLEKIRRLVSGGYPYAEAVIIMEVYDE